MTTNETSTEHSADQMPLAVAGRYFDALAAGDLPAVASLLADDVAWYQPGDNAFSGLHRGPQAVGALVTAMMERSRGSFRIEVTGPAMGNGDLAAVPIRFTGSRPGDAGTEVTMDMPGIDLLTVRDGRIVRVDLFSADAAAEDRFWGSRETAI